MTGAHGGEAGGCVKALTFHQPWAWLIATGIKDIENRRARINHRGTLAIHAGINADPVADTRIGDAIRTWSRGHDGVMGAAWNARGCIIGTVEVVGCHARTEGCCTSEWAQDEYAGKPVLWHVELADAVLLDKPVPARGMPGMWTVPAAVIDAATDLDAVVAREIGGLGDGYVDPWAGGGAA